MPIGLSLVRFTLSSSGRPCDHRKALLVAYQLTARTASVTYSEARIAAVPLALLATTKPRAFSLVQLSASACGPS